MAVTARGGEASAVPQWTLQGPGSLSTNVGRAIEYTPPPADVVTSVLFARLTATLGGDGESASATVIINPAGRPRLVVTPVVAEVAAGGSAVELRAEVLDSTAEVAWLLEGAGSLASSQGLVTAYVPPPVRDVSALTPVRITANLGNGLATAVSTITVRPVLARMSFLFNGPSDVELAATVTGPGGFQQLVGASTRLEGLVAGRYTVTPQSARRGWPFEEYWSAPALSFALENGADVQLPLQWEKRPGTGALWSIAYGSRKLVAIESSQLAAASAVPAVALGVAPRLPSAMAFDGEGGLWLASAGTTSEVGRYSAAVLGRSGTPTPSVRVEHGGGANIRAMAFDRDGTLWLVNSGNGLLRGIPREQLQVSGTATSRLLSFPSGFPSQNIYGLALDSLGRMWVAGTSGHLLAAFSKASLESGGAQTPAVVLQGSATLLQYPMALAFDGDGALWAGNSNATTQQLLKFGPTSLSASGDVPPSVVVTVPGMLGVMSLVPTLGGDLFVVDENAVLHFLRSSSLVTSGTATPVWSRQIDAPTWALTANLPDVRSPVVQ